MLGILSIWTRRQDATRMQDEKDVAIANDLATPVFGATDVPLPTPTLPLALGTMSTSTTSPTLTALAVESVAQDHVDAEGSSSPIGVVPVAVAQTVLSSEPSARKLKKSSSKQRFRLSTSNSGPKITSVDSKTAIAASESVEDAVLVDMPPIQSGAPDIGPTPASTQGKGFIRAKTKTNRISLRSLNFVYPGRRKSALATHHRESSLRLKAAEAGKREALLPQERISLHGSPHPLKNATKAQSRAERRAHKSAVTLQRVIMGTDIDAPAVVEVHAKATKYNFGLKGRKKKQAGEPIMVSKAQLEKVKRELMQPKRANEVIAHLRALPIPTPNGAPMVLAGSVTTASIAATPRPCGPIHAVCLAHTEAEVDATHCRKVQTKLESEPKSVRLSPSNIVSFASASLESIMPLFEDLRIIDLVTAPDLGLGQPGDGEGLLAGAVPTAETVMNGVMQITPQLMALGFATGRAIIPDHKGVYPPLDRMSVITYWWGLEIAMPPPTLKYLASAISIGHAVVNFLTALSIMNNGVREILPFIRYISQFIDFEWSAIKSQDKGKGVVCAATWLMPAAMVPRPWDFPDPPAKKGDEKKWKGEVDDTAGEVKGRNGIDLLDIISPPPPPPVLPKLVVTPPTVKGNPTDDIAPADVTTEIADAPDTSIEAEPAEPATASSGKPADDVAATSNEATPDSSTEQTDEPAVFTSSVTAPTNQAPP